MAGMCTACGTTHSAASAAPVHPAVKTVAEDQVTVKETYTISGHPTKTVPEFHGVIVKASAQGLWAWFYFDNSHGPLELIPQMAVNLSGQSASIASLVKHSPTVALAQVNVVLGATHQWPAALLALPMSITLPLTVLTQNLHGTAMPVTLHIDGYSLPCTAVFDVTGPAAGRRTWTATFTGDFQSTRMLTVIESGTITPVA